jgi:ketosteroid isomerase-like protein
VGPAESFRRGMEAYSRGDYDAAVAGFDPEIKWHAHPSLMPDAGTFHGHEGVKRFWGMWAEAMRDMKLEIEVCREVDENRVLAITRAHGTGAGSGAPVASGRFAQVVDFREGRAVEVWLYGDVSLARKAAGLAD